MPGSIPLHAKWRRQSLFTLRLAAVLSAGVLPALKVRAQATSPLPSAAQDMIPGSNRKPAPAFSLIDAKGERISLAEYKGRVVLLDFWATWCGGCKLEIPWYMQFDQEYRSQGLTVIGVAMDDEGWAKVKPFLMQKKDEETGGNTAMQYPVVLGSKTLARDYRLTSMPMTLLIDRNGKIALSHTGVVDRADFESHIRQLLRSQ